MGNVTPVLWIDFMQYIDEWQDLDREYRTIPSWRIFKQLSNIRKRERLTKAYVKKMRAAGFEI